MEEQTCRTCKQKKSINAFGAYLDKRNNRKRWRRECKRCRTASESKRYRSDPELRRRASMSALKSRLKKTYGITIEDKQKLYDKQSHKCAICLSNVDFKSINVDHCHSSGKIRGLLCWHCNVGVGHFKDDPDLLSRTMGYLSVEDPESFCTWLQSYLSMFGVTEYSEDQVTSILGILRKALEENC